MRRIFKLFLLPLVAVIWLAGWTLCFFGMKKKEAVA
jgi:hypothetical protein